MKGILLILLLGLFSFGCNTYIKYPVKVERVHFNPDGKSCWLRVEPETKGWGIIWVQASEEGCKYKEGDILK
jgi:hypothetical protein